TAGSMSSRTSRHPGAWNVACSFSGRATPQPTWRTTRCAVVEGEASWRLIVGSRRWRRGPEAVVGPAGLPAKITHESSYGETGRPTRRAGRASPAPHRLARTD